MNLLLFVIQCFANIILRFITMSIFLQLLRLFYITIGNKEANPPNELQIKYPSNVYRGNDFIEMTSGSYCINRTMHANVKDTIALIANATL